MAASASRSYGEGVAAVLPRFCVYAHMGKVLAARAGQMSEDQPVPHLGPDLRLTVIRRIDEAGRQHPRAGTRPCPAEGACVYELHFWASAHAMQDWDPSVFVPQS